MTSLHEWNEQFGKIDAFAQKPRVGFDWEFGTAYPVEVTRAEIVKSQKGDVQIKASLIVRNGDGDDAAEAGRAIEYFTLPKQTSDMDKSFDLVTNLTKRRMADVVRILSAANREEYALYANCESVGGRKTYYDFAGNKMTDDTFKSRQSHIHDMIMIWIEDAHKNVGSTLDSLAGTRFYLMKKENPRSKDYPYTNIYALRPDKLPVFGDHAEAPF